MTQKQLARRLGYSVSTVRKLEGDERRPSRATARALAVVLGIPEEERPAFMDFARSGWADVPLSNPRPDLERPWLPLLAAPRAMAVTPRRASTATEMPASAVPTTLLAREAELSQLDTALDEALEGSGGALLIAGDAGQGKTALLTAFAARAQASHPEIVVALGTCNAFTGDGDPFLPFRQVLCQLTGDVPPEHELEPAEQTRLARLRQFMPVAASTLLLEGPSLVDTLVPAGPLRMRLAGADPTKAPAWIAARAVLDARMRAGPGSVTQGALRAEATAALTRMARHAPLVLMLDDLQWADRSSLDLLLQLARSIRGHAILLLGAYRPAGLASRSGEGVPPMVSVRHELQREFGNVTLDLSRCDGRAFVDALLDSEPNTLGAAFREALWQQTAGQPLFTIELLRAMQERGDIARDLQGRWIETDALHWNALPTRVGGVIGERVARLEGNARDVLRVASVEGDVFTIEVVARVLGMEPLSVAGIVGEGLDRNHRLVRVDSTDSGPAGPVSRYRFRHNVIQRFVYGGLDVPVRRYLHEAVADASMHVYGERADPVTVARHFTLAGAPDRAAPHQLVAGRHACRSGALIDAVGYFRTALDVGDALGAPLRAELQRELGACLWLRSDREQAERVLEEAVASFQALGDRRAAGATQLTLARVVFDREAHLGRSGALFDQALASLESEPESADLARGYSATAMAHLILSEETEALRRGRRALELADRLGAEDVRPRALSSVGNALAILHRHRFEEGVAMIAEAFRTADQLGLVEDASDALLALADVHEAHGRAGDALDRWRTFLEHARRHQLPAKEWFARTQLLRMAWRSGDWLRAFEEMPYLETQAETKARPAFQLAGIQLDLGRPSEAQATMAPYLRRVRPDIELHIVAPMYATLLRAAAGSGRTGEADALATTLVDVCHAHPGCAFDATTPVMVASQWLARRGRGDREGSDGAGIEVLERAVRQFGTPETRAALAQARAAAAHADGAATAAAAALAEAAGHWQAAGFPLDEARARAALGHVLHASGQVAHGAAELRSAHQTLQTLARHIPHPDVAAAFRRRTSDILAPPDVDDGLFLPY